MTEANWVSYPCRLGGRPATVSCDLGLSAPDPARPWMAYVWLELAGIDEARRVEVVARLQGAVPGGPVGTVETEDRYEMYFYAVSPEGFAEWAGSALEEAEADATVGCHEDPDWNHYRDVLLPRADGEVEKA